MKLSTYDRITGKFRKYGNENAKFIRDEIAAGHITDEEFGGSPDWLMYDFAGTPPGVVPDVARRQASQDREQARQDKTTRWNEIRDRLEVLYGDHSPTALNEQIDLLNEYVRL